MSVSFSPVRFGAIWQVQGTRTQIEDVKQQLQETAGDSIRLRDMGGYENAGTSSFNLAVITGEDTAWYDAALPKKQALMKLAQLFRSKLWNPKNDLYARQMAAAAELDTLLDGIVARGGNATMADARRFKRLAEKQAAGALPGEPELLNVYAVQSSFDQGFQTRSQGGARLKAHSVLSALRPDPPFKLDIENGQILDA